MNAAGGSFIWYDLMTDDIDRTAAFYADVVGWTVAPGAAEFGGARFGLVGVRAP